MLLEAIPVPHACVHSTALSGCPSGWVALRGSCRSAGGLRSGWFSCARVALHCRLHSTQPHATCNVQRSVQGHCVWPRQSKEGLRPDHPTCASIRRVCVCVWCACGSSCALAVNVCMRVGRAAVIRRCFWYGMGGECGTAGVLYCLSALDLMATRQCAPHLPQSFITAG